MNQIGIIVTVIIVLCVGYWLGHNDIAVPVYDTVADRIGRLIDQ